MLFIRCVAWAFVASIVLAACFAADAARPRGVHEEDDYLYQGEQFQCLDGLKTVAKEQVNDEYCDCKDGSDEPGTSACSGTTLSVKPFACTNEGFAKVQIFPHSRINDGICDCCDGSDEFLGYVECPNICAQAMAEEERAAKEAEELRQQGLVARKAMVEKAANLRSQKQQELDETKAKLADTEKTLVDAQLKVSEAEIIENQEREVIKERSLRDKEEWEKKQAEKKAQEGAAPQEPQAAPVDDYQGVSYPCVKWRQTGGCLASGPREEHGDLSCNERVSPGASGFCECENPEDPDTPVTYDRDCGHPEITCDYVCTHGGDNNPEPEAKKPSALEPEEFKLDDGSSHQNEAARQARSHLENIKSEKSTFEIRINDLQKAVSDDFGPDGIMQAMDGECYSMEQKDYKYELCPFQHATQHSTKGGGRTRLGGWKGFGEQSYSMWGAKQDFNIMKFADGDHCWNGPSRSVEVHLTCGAENKLLAVDEPSMCTYKMRLSSPAVCE